MTNEQEQAAITKYDLYYESRMTRMETIAEQLVETTKEIKSDLRWMFGIMIGFSGILLGLMANGFKWF
jgi:hypothetical protein